MRAEKALREKGERLHKNDKGYKSAGNWHFLLYLIGLFIAVMALRAFVFEPIRVDGESMLNTLVNNERCVVEKVSYWFTSPKAGDIVIVHYPGEGNKTFVKRVIATEGQTVEIRREELRDGGYTYCVYVDGNPLDETAYYDQLCFDEPMMSTGVAYADPVTGKVGVCTVPEGCVFVMGDHRSNSRDSRTKEIGPIELTSVIGRVRGVMYPFTNIRGVH